MRRKRSVWLAQRAIVLQVLRDDHDLLWTRTELEREIFDLPARAVHAALGKLGNVGVVVMDDERVRASRCARHLDALGLVSI